MPERYFIKLPRPNGKWEYEEVEVPRLSLDTIKSIYTMDRSRDKPHYVPAFGVGALVSDHLVLTELKEAVEEVLARINLALEGEEGERVRQAVIAPLAHLVPCLEAVGRDEPLLAQKFALDLLHGIEAGVGELADALRVERRTLEGVTVAADALGETIATADYRDHDLYLQWADAADKLVRSATALAQFEQRLRARRAEFDRQRESAALTLAATQPTIHAAVEFLNGSERSFLVDAHMFLHLGNRRQLSRAGIEEAALQAASHVKACRKLEAGEVMRLRTLAVNIQEEITSQRRTVDEWLDNLAAGAKVMHEMNRLFPAGTARPHQVKKLDRRYLEEAEYRRAEEILRDHRWVPTEARRRINILVSQVEAVYTELLTLPQEIKQTIERAESYVREIEALPPEAPVKPVPVPAEVAAAARPVAPTAVAAPHLPPRVGAEEVLPPAMAVPAPPAAPQPLGVEELYELVICAGYVLTGRNSSGIYKTTPDALLNLLVFMRQVTQADVVRLRSDILSRFTAPGECERVPEPRLVPERWRRTPARWVVYPIWNNPKAKAPVQYAKCAQHTFAEAEALLAKHGLTKAMIQEANDIRRNRQP